jgi:hypothetical protein
MEEPKMSEQDSMKLIASMINKAKNQVSENGFLYIIWGWVIIICCAVQFLSDQFFHYPKAYYIWFSMYAVIIFQIIYLIRKKKSDVAKTYTEEINGFVWIAFAIGFMLMVFICSRFEAKQLILPLLLVFYGIPTFLSGSILKFTPLMIGGICCWILAFVSTFIAFEYQLILIATAVIAAWLIPGYLLQIRYKKTH